MIYKCPNCNGALEYNPATDEMECAHCGSGFTMQEVEAGNQKKKEHTYNQQTGRQDVLVDGESVKKASAEADNDASEAEIDIFADRETMDCNIYTCTSCGAELFINDNEAATFCAYCGQPTVVFSRVAKELKPDSIVPFKITREQAVNGIREHLNKKNFVPKQIKNFNVDKVRGIYVPYWVFDIYYYDWQSWEYTTGEGRDKRTISYDREAECMLKGLTLDASKNLNDELSQRLEPYDVRTRKPFEPGYLSGFYADKYDLEEEKLRNYAYYRAKQFFDAEVHKTIPQQYATIKWSHPKRVIKKAEYMLLPAWFITFRYNYETYTMLVNGQTGKIVGTVPFDKKKVRSMFITIAAIVSLFATAFIYCFIDGVGAYFGALIFLFIPMGLFMVSRSDMRKLTKAMNLTREYETAEYVQERQDRD